MFEKHALVVALPEANPSHLTHMWSTAPRRRLSPKCSLHSAKRGRDDDDLQSFLSERHREFPTGRVALMPFYPGGGGAVILLARRPYSRL